jgi:cation diffusion facilitator family transporter
MKDKYYSVSLRVSLMSVVVNIILTLVKLILGIISNSVAIITDAIHSFSDLATTLVVIFSINISKKPADRRHPFGHGRAEDVGGFAVSFILFLVGIAFFKESLMRLVQPQAVKITVEIIIAILITALVKLFLGIFTSNRARRIKSSLLSTDALHHYSDLYTSLAVFIGLIFVKNGFVSIDAWLGIFVSLFIVFAAVKQGRLFIDNLIGKQISGDDDKKIRSIVLSFPRVESVHGINVHSYGRNRIISLHIVVQKNLSLEDAHSLADSIEKKIYSEGLGKCLVHVDLQKVSLGGRRSDIEKAITYLVDFYPAVTGYHSLDMICTENKNIINFHIMLDKGTSLEDAHHMSHAISSFLKTNFNLSQVNIHIEPDEEVNHNDR